MGRKKKGRRTRPGGYSSFVSVERGLRALEVLGTNPQGLSLSRLADEVEIAPATAHRVLAALEAAGYVIRRDDKIRLSLRLIALAYRYMWALDWKQYYSEPMARLSDETGELVQLAVVGQDALFMIDKVEGKNALRVASVVGEEIPLHATASGKVWLASLEDEQLVRVLSRAPLKAYAKNTMTSLDRLLADLQIIRRRSYGTSLEEYQDSTAAIAAPVRPTGGDVVVGAVSVTFPATLIPTGVLDHYPQTVMRCSEELTPFGIRLYEEFARWHAYHSKARAPREGLRRRS